ncbi:protein C2-DOMAIN ABA-RELATED 9-like isoform X2 [Glycine soja]|uniref:protein C2-DOMAIN ABA-RELATED 9-like isoform X2 n=1 Tax=Glycine soja TaxID=3848 RepID=UPI00023D91AD|nr:protein C2-DOMAIN ABA-RELATED 9-like isoform X2 [Glycine soja]XP_040868888.1 protein C2-DOMAIN ABA-RELATED 9-like isoform X2 [Glycine max]
MDNNNILGLLKLRIKRGINLAIRDARASDPYVVVNMGDQTVYDKDTFSVDDKMGEAEIDLKPYVQCKQMGLGKLPNGCSLKRIQPDRTNYLAEESSCIWQNGKIVQEMFLRLRNVESGEILVEIEWVDVVGCRGLSQVEL